MDISQYKNSMDEIAVKMFRIEDLLNQKKKRSRHTDLRKFMLAFVLIGILFCDLILFHNFPGDSTKVTITAYAAENEIQLENNFVDFNVDAQPILGETDNGKEGYVNSNIFFRCEGENIKSITYTCSDWIIDRNNRNTASAYYVENLIIPIDDYHNRIKDKDSIYGYYVPGENTANLTKIIGNSYSVNYEEQNSKQYGLIIAATIDNAGNFQIKDTIIKIDICYQDGTIQQKKIIIKSSENVFSGIQLRIL